jgi:hypothetical protein
MQSKLTVSMLVIGSLLGAPVIAFAQTEPAAKPRVTQTASRPCGCGADGQQNLECVRSLRCQLPGGLLETDEPPGLALP